MSLFSVSRRETLVFIAVTIILIGGFGGPSVFSILNTNSRNDACRSCRDGARPNITIGSVVAMPCANNTIIYNSGNKTNVVLNFGIPSGCTGQKGPDAVTYLHSAGFVDASLPFRNTTNMSIFINATETITYTPVTGPMGPQGNAGPRGPIGAQGSQGVQGIQGPLILGYGRIITSGTQIDIPIPTGATVIYYTMAGGGGGGGGGGGAGNRGCAGGGGASGFRVVGFETLIGITSVITFIGDGGSGGLSYDYNFVPTPGYPGRVSVLSLNPLMDLQAPGGYGGSACNNCQGGKGGDGWYGGGGGGTGATEECNGGTGGRSYAEGFYTPAGIGYSGGGNGGQGAGQNAGVGGRGNGITGDTNGNAIGLSGGGGGGGGPRLSCGGQGGSFMNGSISGSGFDAPPGSSCGGGGSAGNHAGGSTNINIPTADLITYGDIGGHGGNGYLDYFFM